MTARAYVLGAVVLAAVVGCGSTTGGEVRAAPAGQTASPTVTETAGPEMSGLGFDAPPPFRLRYADREVALRPYTFCYDGGCADGMPPKNPHSVGAVEAVWVHVPVDDWDLRATFTPAGKRCGRHQTVEPQVDDAGWYVLEPAGRAGSYDVELFAQGGGDMVASFRWDTPTDGVLPTPAARLALIADHDGEPDSYGVELSLSNLAATPADAVAEIRVTAANGRSLTFEGARASDCQPDGSVYWDGPDEKGLQAAQLGDFPFDYKVTVTLDGTTHVATATYPDDEIEGNEPSVALSFSPPLPRLR